MAAEFAPGRARRQLAGLTPGTLIGGYRIEAPVGEGGMAVVFRARDEALGRTVALKVLAPAASRDPEFRERFTRESRTASMVDHPNIIPVYAAGENDGGVLYLAMRYVPGGDLHAVMEREGPLAPGRAASLLSPVASALDAAHRAGLVHRDVKPANVLVDTSPGRPDHPYLSDFGLAKGATARPGLTSAGEFVGTAGFAAPEQISGRPARYESDQYALACVAFTILTASMPFRYGDPEAVLWAQMSKPPPLVTPQRPDLTAAVDEVIGRGLAKNPLDRYPSCGAFAGALSQALGAGPNAPVLARHPSFPAPDPYSPPGGRTLPPRKPPPSRQAPSFSQAPPPSPAPSFGQAPPFSPAPLSPAPPTRSEPPAGPASRAPSAGPARRRSRKFLVTAGAVVIVAAAAAVLVREVSGTPATGKPGPTAAAHMTATLNDGTGQNVTSAVFGPDGTLDTVDQAGYAYSFRLAWELATSTYDLGGADLSSARLSLDGKAIAVPGEGCAVGTLERCDYGVYFFQLREWDATILAGKGGAFGVGRSILAVPTPAGDSVEVWNLQGLDRVADLATPDQRPVTGIAVSPDDTAVAVSTEGADGTSTVYVWSLKARSLTAAMTVPGRLGVTQPAGTAAQDPGGQAAAMALDDGGGTLAIGDGQRTAIYDVGSRRQVATAPGGLAALSPDGRLFATTDPAGGALAELRETRSGKTAATLSIPAATPAAAPAPATARGAASPTPVAVPGAASPTFTTAPGATPPAASTTEVTPSAVVFSSNSQSVAAACDNDETYVWRLAVS